MPLPTFVRIQTSRLSGPTDPIELIRSPLRCLWRNLFCAVCGEGRVWSWLPGFGFHQVFGSGMLLPLLWGSRSSGVSGMRGLWACSHWAAAAIGLVGCEQNHCLKKCANIQCVGLSESSPRLEAWSRNGCPLLKELPISRGYSPCPLAPSDAMLGVCAGSEFGGVSWGTSGSSGDSPDSEVPLWTQEFFSRECLTPEKMSRA